MKSRIVFLLTLIVLLNMQSYVNAQQEVSSYESLNDQFIDTYKSDESDFRRNSIATFKGMPDNALWEILASSRFDLLRIAAYIAISDRSAEFRPRATVSLLVHSETLGAFELSMQYVDANVIESNEFCDELSQALRFGLDQNEIVNCDGALRMLPTNSLFRILDSSEKNVLPASNLSLVLNALLRQKETVMVQDKKRQEKVNQMLLSLKFSPGRPQLTFVYYFSFEKPQEALPHLSAIIRDRSLATPEVLMAMSKHADLVLSNESRLTEHGKLDIAVARFKEFQKRFID